MSDLPLVSVVFITYKRYDLLKLTYDSFKNICIYPNLQFVLSDDGSPQEIKDKMRSLFFNKYLFSPKNKGLGNNQNRGITAADGEYTLHLQDDCLCHGPGDFIEVCLAVFDELPDVGYIRLWNKQNLSIPYDIHRLKNGLIVRVYDDTHNSNRPDDRDYLYSDQPHIKRRSFHERLGLYQEDVSMNDMEIDFCQRFEQQGSIRGAWIEGYGNIFEHIGREQTFNPHQRSANRRAWLENHAVLRFLYRLLRFGRK